MLGAIIGDIAGSRFEWHNIKTKVFDLFTRDCSMTDDSLMTLAVARALLESRQDPSQLRGRAIAAMQEIGRRYPYAGFGGHFSLWLQEADPQPYGSYGNGAAMRVSACGFAARSLEEAVALSNTVTAVSHDHPESLKGAAATVSAVYLARTGTSMEGIREYLQAHYYPLDFTLDEIRPGYRFDVSCQGSVPQALEAFLESDSFEDAIRNAISIGGDSDTIAAITGGIAEAYYGIPERLRCGAMRFITDESLRSIVSAFEQTFPCKAGTDIDF